jgi:hypothetical protein
MLKLFIFWFSIISISVNAQYFPAANQSYNYTQMPFEWEGILNVDYYILNIKE